MTPEIANTNTPPRCSAKQTLVIFGVIIACVCALGWLTGWAFASLVTAGLLAFVFVNAVEIVSPRDERGFITLGRPAALALAAIVPMALAATWVQYGAHAAKIVGLCIFLLGCISIFPENENGRGVVFVGETSWHIGNPLGMLVVGYGLWLFEPALFWQTGLNVAMAIAAVWVGLRLIARGSGETGI